MSIQASKSPDLEHQNNKVLCFKNHLSIILKACHCKTFTLTSQYMVDLNNHSPWGKKAILGDKNSM